jgi:hypothetical protein
MPREWRRLLRGFPGGELGGGTFTGRSERISERLGQVASALLIIGFSTLFIGGLGVFNSIQAYLQGKLATIATLRALGCATGGSPPSTCCRWAARRVRPCRRPGRLRHRTRRRTSRRRECRSGDGGVRHPAGAVYGHGVRPAHAFTFSLPAIGRALSIDPAALFRMIDGSHRHARGLVGGHRGRLRADRAAGDARSARSVVRPRLHLRGGSCCSACSSSSCAGCAGWRAPSTIIPPSAAASPASRRRQHAAPGLRCALRCCRWAPR